MLECAELTRQIRGGTREVPPIGDLYFKDEYIDAASASKRSDGSMNYLVEKYDRTLKQTMIQLGASEKLARARLSVIERLRAENKKASDKRLRRKKFFELNLKSLKEKAEFEGDRDAVVETLVKERQRLRDSRIREVTCERVRVQTAMADKYTRCFGREEVTSEIERSTSSVLPLEVNPLALVPTPVESPTVPAAEDPEDLPASNVLTGSGEDDGSVA
ncbi:hypothetical protein F2Q68_00030559 [Brassica cretica]|uniref:Uncharacterized protein n=1 Tax=Brassica cretica TaxID=69181 RepID=A0A8S9GBB6_BRACR|nr:hypothetical protein F2Q68_00030559 [Brassica cretica]